MAISPQGYKDRANQLLSLDYQDATPRIAGFVEWLEADPEAAAALQQLRDHNIQSLIDDAGFQRSPKAKSAEDVAAVALWIIDDAAKHNTQIFRVGMAVGIRARGSRIQDTSDEISRRYIRPLLQYLETRLFGAKPLSGGVPEFSQPLNPKDIFVVHGRNERLRRAMFTFLRSLGLNPLEWEEALALTKKGAPYIGEVLDAAFARAGAVIVLLTPDDEARLKSEFLKLEDGPEERELTGQARANVLFEAGMAFGRHQDRTVLAQVGTIRPFSDVAGRHVLHLSNDIGKRQALVNRLRTIGCDLNQVGTDWHHEGDFSAVLPIGSTEAPGSPVSNSWSTQMSKLSQEAQTLLREATADPTGQIMRMELGDGLSIQTNNRAFVEGGNARSRAIWEDVIHELEREALIRPDGPDREYFKVTNRGYVFAESVKP
jgi:predicted nucleotide-binding protein